MHLFTQLSFILILINRQGHTGMVKLLIQNGASTDKIDLKNGDNILHLAVKQVCV